MSDPFKNHNRGLESPAIQHLAIAPSDTVDLPLRPRVIYVQTAGTVTVQDGVGVTLSYTVSEGQILPISPKRIMATGTTATIYGWL